MAKKKAKAKAALWAPQTREEVASGIEEIGLKQRERTVLETRMNDEIAAIQSRYAELAAPINERLDVLQTGVAIWCESHRDELTENGKIKTHDFPTGQVKWRLTPWSVTLRGVDEILKALRRLKLTKYIRTKYEINKQALLEDREKGVKLPTGITFNQSEEFIIVPDETAIETVVSTK
jgi:phage host-nuclease inhibitor protein Gam